MTPTDVLRDEHRVILRALELLERATAREPADAWWADVVAWLRAFADRNHHAKEEAALFPAMVKAGVPSENGPIAIMLEEHAEGRRLVATIGSATGGARARAGRAYVALLRAHIDKENAIVFPLADAVLDAPADAALQREFEAVEVEQGVAASIAAGDAAVDRLAAALEPGG
ncbi:MAG TPA: hemerythrin domain-containing protein [Methylomirabilota bacterium]|nr:hemerythrin domain-containing protein [Methylomirabilota bacterium]